MGKQVFDYDKTEVGFHKYYGFHRKDGRYHLDTKRLTKLGVGCYFPDALFQKSRNTHYFIPRYKQVKDYSINLLSDIVDRLRNEWFQEFVPIINRIKTPDQEAEQVRIDRMMETADSDDYEDCSFAGFMAGIRRMTAYRSVVQSIHLQYLQKIQIEYLRILLLILRKNGYIDKDFRIKSFLGFSNQYLRDKKVKRSVKDCPSWAKIDIFNRVINLLKHNTEKAYDDLMETGSRKNPTYPKFLKEWVDYPSNEKEPPYKNGMYAGNWIKLTEKTIPNTLDLLDQFSDEYCKLLFEEDRAEAGWNSDEALIRILKDEVLFSEY